VLAHYEVVGNYDIHKDEKKTINKINSDAVIGTRRNNMLEHDVNYVYQQINSSG
jgi:hypothetical protein